MAVRLSPSRAGRALPPGRFLVIISVRGWVNLRAILRLEGLSKLKKVNDFIGNRALHLPVCSIESQPTKHRVPVGPRSSQIQVILQFVETFLHILIPSHLHVCAVSIFSSFHPRAIHFTDQRGVPNIDHSEWSRAFCCTTVGLSHEDSLT
jgi:hypothetical protein